MTFGGWVFFLFYSNKWILLTEKPGDAVGGITFVRGDWCEEGTNLETTEVKGCEYVGNEAQTEMYQYIYRQSVLVVKKEDLK